MIKFKMARLKGSPVHTHFISILYAGPTWSSTGSEASCAAVAKACQQLVRNLSEAAQGVKEHSASKFWEAVIGKVDGGIGYAPASAQLSAVGYFDGTETGGRLQSFH